MNVCAYVVSPYVSRLTIIGTIKAAVLLVNGDRALVNGDRAVLVNLLEAIG